MDFYEINFNKKNRRPITETTYQIDAAEWNALGKKVRDISLNGGGGGTGAGLMVESSWDEKDYTEYPIE